MKIEELAAIADAAHQKAVEYSMRNIPEDSIERIKLNIAADRAWEAKFAADKALREAMEAGGE